MTAFAHTLAEILFAGAWTDDALLERLREAFPTDPPWLDRLVDQLYAYEDPESLGDVVSLLPELPAFAAAVRERPLERGAVPEMAESPWPVPALATVKELAVWLGVDVDALVALADRRGISRTARDPRARHYRYTWVAKRGGHRLLEAPKPRLRETQRNVLDGIVAQIPPHDAAHGFRAGRSIMTSAVPHVGRDVVIRLDLVAFFTSVFAQRVYRIFRTAGYPDEVAQLLAALCTHRTPSEVLASSPMRDPITLSRLRAPHLPQGAPTSGALANLAAYRFDIRVAALAASLGAQYTRYADDLAISGARDLTRAAPTVIARVGAIAIEEGFAVNFRKTRVMTRSRRQRLTGLVVNEKLAVPRDDVERLRAILTNCARTGPAAQNRDGHRDFRAHLLGRVAWVASIDRAKGARLRALFDRIDWS